MVFLFWGRLTAVFALDERYIAALLIISDVVAPVALLIFLYVNGSWKEVVVPPKMYSRHHNRVYLSVHPQDTG